MSFLIAAAGTGGHVFPGLAVGEALVSAGVDRSEILFVGGDRLEATVYPEAGYEFLSLELRGLKRSFSPSNLSLPRVVWRARDAIAAEVETRGARAVLGMGGYVTLSAALAARKTRVPLLISEQNAGAGLANRFAARWARHAFMAFPHTEGLPNGEWVGNPVREEIASFRRDDLRPHALAYFRLEAGIPVVGVFGGSLGAASINEAVAKMVASWDGPRIQILHLVGRGHETAFADATRPAGISWVRRGFENRMDLFFAAADLVVARAGGAVAEITATATPSILVPGDFGSSGHQSANAAYLAKEGAALVLAQGDLGSLGDIVTETISNSALRNQMAASSAGIARPDAAKVIAQAMIELAR